jgi:aspartate dehydrogenase
MKIGIIGCGAIGGTLAREISKRFPLLNISCIYDKDLEKTKKLFKTLIVKPKISSSISNLVKGSDFVIEAASLYCVKEVANICLKEKKGLLVMSVGGFVLHPQIIEDFKKANVRLIIPSGAICGLDGIKAGRLGNIYSATLTTKKHPDGFKGAPGLKKNRISLDNIVKDRILFNGSAKEAIEGFPANINVAAALSLATGLGADRVGVKIIAVPNLRKNVHQIEVEGEFGKITTITENLPSKENPRTSFLAILSALSCIQSLTETIRVGT